MVRAGLVVYGFFGPSTKMQRGCVIMCNNSLCIMSCLRF
jgi:hypothetical protein